MTKTVHYICKYTPVELLEGFGLTPVLLDPRPADFSCAESCAHANLCGYGKGVLEAVLSGASETGGIRALIVTDCCDVMRRVYDILAERHAVPFLYFLPLPHKADEASVRMFAAELKRLTDALEDFSGVRFDSAAAGSAWARTAQAAEPGAHGKDRLVLRGAHVSGELLAQVRAHFSLPVENETCSGARELQRPREGDGFVHGFAAYAAALLMQSRPCVRMLREGDPADAQAACGAGLSARGMLFHTVKFCDYYGFLYRRLQRKLAEEAIPVLRFETDLTKGSAGQLATRFDAFAETIGAGAQSGMREGRGDAERKGRRESDAAGALRGTAPRDPKKLFVAGIDSGSTSTDAVIMDGERHMLGTAIVPTGAKAKNAAREALAQALAEAGISADALVQVVATGYGRETIGEGDAQVTEITCHARGAHFLDPGVRTVIDIGGQDSKVIAMDADGHVSGFAMNDKCAAGTGRFMEQMARVLELSLADLGKLGLSRREEITISSMCTVFAESEVVSLIAENKETPDIVYGLCDAVAVKTMPLVGRAGGGPSYMMTGGVSRNQSVVRALERRLQAPVSVPEKDLGQLCGAIGAALIALDRSGGNGLV